MKPIGWESWSLGALLGWFYLLGVAQDVGNWVQAGRNEPYTPHRIHQCTYGAFTRNRHILDKALRGIT